MTVDPKTLTRRETERWAGNADGWTQWAEPMAEPADRLNQPLLDAAELKPGQRLLDLASGVGEPVLTAAARLHAAPASAPGAGSLVVATDIVPDMLVGLARRVRPDAPLHLAAADMETLPFATASFDRIISRFGVMFVPSLALASAEIARVLASGGRCALMVWGPREDNTLFRLIGDSIEATAERHPQFDLRVEDPSGATPDAGVFSPLRLADPAPLLQALRAAGLRNVAAQSLRLERAMPATQPIWIPLLDMTCGATFRRLPEAQRKSARDAVLADLEARVAAISVDGRFAVTLHAIVVTADKP